MNRVIADDGLHFEHFVLSSADADRGTDGEMRFKLLRPLKRVKSVRLVYAELPKTTRTLDLMVDVGTKEGRLVTQQLARSVFANENDTSQRSSFGRIFVQDFETDDFFEDIAIGAFAKGTVPRFLYENASSRYMRFEFRPSTGVLQNINLRMYSALLDTNGQPTAYTPDLFVVTTGSALRDRNSTLTGADNLARLLPLVLQASTTLIKLRPPQDYGARFLGELSNFFTVADFATIAATPALGNDLLLGSLGPSPLQPIRAAVESKAIKAPDVNIQITDASPARIDAFGIVATPCLYSLKSLPAEFQKFLFTSTAYSLGTLFPITWLTLNDVTVSLRDEPYLTGFDYPLAFRAEDRVYDPPNAAEQDRERNLQFVRVQRCVVALSPEVAAVVAHPDPNIERVRLKYLLRTMQIRTAPAQRPVHGVLNSSLKAEQVQLYSVVDVLRTHPGLEAYVRADHVRNTGEELPVGTRLVAVELDRSLSAFTDSEVVRPGGAPVDLVCSRDRYIVDGGNGFSVPWEADTVMAASFPFTITFEAEIDQYQ